MKHNGCVSQFIHERNDDLMRAFRLSLHGCRVISMTEIFNRVVKTPSKRFWVSEERAAEVISAMFAGRSFPNMRVNRKRMFDEIFRRAVALRGINPRMSVYDIAITVVNQPAPEFYFTPGSAKVIIYKIKRGFYDRHGMR